MTRPRAPLGVLVVEDEGLVALDIEMMIEDCGHRVVAEAASLHEVAALSADLAPDLAFVDVQLADETSGLDVCDLIQHRWQRTFIVYVTANPNAIEGDLRGAHGVIPKPFSRNGLLSAMRYIEQGMCDPPPASPQPDSFLASAAFASSWR